MQIMARQKLENAAKGPGLIRGHNRRFGIEALEPRRLLTALVVTTNSDAASHTGKSLRDAVVAASADARAGTSDTITFASSLKGQTIALSQGNLEVGVGGAGSGSIAIMGANQVAISGNHASRVFYVDAGVQASIAGLTITAGGSASTITNGAGVFSLGTLTISNCTFSGNSATNQSGTGGGAVENFNATMTINNSTFFGNTASQGGAIYNHGALTVSNSTFTGNSAGTYGGGINNFRINPLTLLNCIVAGNTATAGSPDIDGTVQGASSYNVIGDGAGMSGVNNGEGGNKIGFTGGAINPRLAPLAYYGGATQTMALLAGGPAINAGGPLTHLAAAISSTATTVPVALASNIANARGSYVIKVDSERMLVTNVSGNTFTATRGYNSTTKASHAANAAVIFATDQNGRGRVGAVDIGAYEATTTVFGSQVVTTASDAIYHTGVSVRDAIGRTEVDAANGHSDTITFASGLKGQTITLTQGQLELSGVGAGVTTINGASQITVSGNHASRVFLIDAGVHASFTGLTITAGGNAAVATNGAGIFNYGSATISKCTFSGNSTTFAEGSGGGAIDNFGTMTITTSTLSDNQSIQGGGVYNHGMLKISGSTISLNVADNGPGEGVGGGIFNYTTGTLSVTASTIYGNDSEQAGGIYNIGTMTVADSTISFSVVNVDGGGILNLNAATVTGCTFYQDRSIRNGGGIANLGVMTVGNCSFNSDAGTTGGGLYNGGSLTVSHSTINNNDADQHGGGIANASGFTLTLLDTIVAGNRTNTSAPDIYGAVQSASMYNLIGNPSGMTGISNGVGGNLVGTAAKPISAGLSPLANNGGATQTMALTSTSLARNAGGRLTTLTAAVTATATSLPVGLGSAIATTAGSYVVKIDSEQILVTNSVGNKLTVTRGYNGTTAASHASGAKIYQARDQRGKTRDAAPDIGAFEY